MTETWRLIDTGPRPAHENLALDEAMLEAKAEEPETPGTVRFLRYDPKAALVGFHQSVEDEVRTEFCHENNIDINRRITGGGAIFFHPSHIGWELISTTGNPSFTTDVNRLYELVGEAAAAGIRRLGIEAEYRPKNDIEVGGRKISGTGGAIEGEAFLFQGTLLNDMDVEEMLKALNIPVEKLDDKEVESIKDRVTSLREIRGEMPEIGSVQDSLLDAFQDAFNFDAEPGELTALEKELYEEKLEKFQSREWIRGRSAPSSSREVVEASNKAEGGLIRAQLGVDPRNRKLHFAYVTGDFFVYPDRTIYDLEATLKDASLDNVEEKIRRFFEDREPDMPGLEPDGFVETLNAALEQLET